MGVAYRTWQHRVPEGVSWEPLDRLVGRDGTLILASDVSTIDIRIFQVPDREALYSQIGFGPGNGTTGPIFNALQVDQRWTPADRGYNSRHLITPALMLAQSFEPHPGSLYRLEIITHTSPWQEMVSVHEYQIAEVYSVEL